MARMTATEASRSFSDLLDRVGAGEEVEITRGGQPVAIIGPPAPRLVPARRLSELLSSAPRPDDGFADDLRTLRREAGPPREPWPS